MPVQLFTIEPAAKSQLVQLLSGLKEAGVVVLVAEIPSDLPLVAGDDDAALADAIRAGEAFLRSIKGPVVHRWTLGGAERARFPDHDVYEVDGIPFYLPSEMPQRVSGRVLRVHNGVLEFEPPIPPLVA